MNHPSLHLPLAYIVLPAVDLPGQWVGHCLDLDLVTQGDSLRDAVESIGEAVDLVLESGDVPRYKRAPQSFWDLFVSVLSEGERVNMDDILSRPSVDVGVLAGYLLPDQTEAPQQQRRKGWELAPNRMPGASSAQV
jgi:predicted RNase H-like HicB family nuclease